MMAGTNLQGEAATRNEGCGRRTMKVICLQLALPIAILAIAFSAAARAEGTDTAAVSTKTVQAKMQYCEVCHGPSGQGFVGFYPIPRLAGQQTEYFRNQLQAFVERRRVNPIMFNVAHVLSPAMQTALVTNFNELNPKPLGGAPKDLVTAGKTIYGEGVPQGNVPACSGCHGADAKGKGEFPRLAGQLYPYVVRELTDWSKERGQNSDKPDTSAIMQPIAHSLTEPQVKAVAAYLSTQE
jgi:cytochrome c553